MSSLLKCIPRVMKELSLWNFKINNNQFAQIVQACKDIKILHFKFCEINSDYRIDFDETLDYKIKILNFSGTGASKRSDWKRHKHKLEHIVEAICACKLNQSLEKVGFFYCLDKNNNIKTLFESYSASNINITEDYLSDSEN